MRLMNLHKAGYVQLDEDMESRKQTELERQEKLKAVTDAAAATQRELERICGQSPLGHVFVQDSPAWRCVGCGGTRKTIRI